MAVYQPQRSVRPLIHVRVSVPADFLNDGCQSHLLFRRMAAVVVLMVHKVSHANAAHFLISDTWRRPATSSAIHIMPPTPPRLFLRAFCA